MHRLALLDLFSCLIDRPVYYYLSNILIGMDNFLSTHRTLFLCFISEDRNLRPLTILDDPVMSLVFGGCKFQSLTNPVILYEVAFKIRQAQRTKNTSSHPISCPCPFSSFHHHLHQVKPDYFLKDRPQLTQHHHHYPVLKPLIWRA